MNQIKRSRSEQKRQDIIDAAQAAFQELGVDAVSMDMLAARANVSKRTVYNHFDSKQALVTHLLRGLWEQTVSQKAQNFDPSRDIRQQLIDLLLIEIRLVNDRHYIDMARMAFGYLLYNEEELLQEIRRMADKETLLTAWLRTAASSGVLKVHDVDLADRQIHSLVKGQCFWPQLSRLKEQLGPDEEKALAVDTAELFLARYLNT